jgi:hypothetical protein
LPRGSGPPAIEERLHRLEANVIQLLDAADTPESGHSSKLPSNSTSNHVNISGGRGPGLLKDRFPTVVEDIMDSIHQLRLELPNTIDEPDVEEPINGREDMVDNFILGLPVPPSKDTILSRYMPSQKEAEQLLGTYFGGGTFIQPFIHAQQFQRQYHTFQHGQFYTASGFWLSILFSIFSIAAFVREGTGPEETAHKSSHKFLAAAGQCLVLGRYHDTRQNAPEALLLYAHCKGLRSLDPSRECGAIICMAVRHAYELGYHRDPDNFGRFTVFEGEMRRRFWACCKQVDTMVSFQLGLPNNIILDNCDTKSPLNLLDSDFDSDVQILPQPRPESEPTPILWFIVKDRLMPVFARICQAVLSLRLKSEIQVMELDAEARKAYATIPDILRWRPVSESIADPSFLIMFRLFLELLYLKGLCILHLRYMACGNANSIVQCIQAACSIIRSIADIHCAFRPDGHLQAVSWMFNNYVMTDFLLGASTLCLHVNLGRRRRAYRNPMMPTLEEISLLLKRAHSICVDKSLSSTNAKKVGQSIERTLESAQGNLSVSLQPTAASVTESQQQPTIGIPVPGLTDWPIDYTDWDSSSGYQFTFSDLDPFNFISNGFIDIEQFYNADTFAEDFNVAR